MMPPSSSESHAPALFILQTLSDYSSLGEGDFVLSIAIVKITLY